MTARTRSTAPAPKPIAPQLPDDLSGWHWISHPSGSNELAIEAPDQDWRTKWYFHPTKAIAEARRRVLSEPKPAAPDPAPLPPGSSSVLTLSELVAALDIHAAALRTHLDQATTIPIPAGLPTQFDAPIDLITPGRYQPRRTFAEEELRELAVSITEHGILNRLKVFASEKGELELIAGERRLRAARIAGLSFVPIEICALTLRQIHEISIVDNLQRADLSPAEEGTAYERLISELQISEAELARRLGKNRAYIQQRRAVAQACPEVLQALATEAISFSQARAIAQAAPGLAKAQQAALKAIGLTKSGRSTTEADARRETEKAVIATCQRDLEALGWRIYAGYHGALIWSPSDRPRAWTGAEILDAVSTFQFPRPRVDAEAPAQLDTAQLEQRYIVDTEAFAPWVSVRTDYNTPPTFYAPSEIPALVEGWAMETAAMQARYAAAGWVIGRTKYGQGWEATHPTGAREALYSWETVTDHITKVEAGAFTPTELAQAARKADREHPKQPCSRCKTPVRDMVYYSGSYFCNSCADQIRAEVAATKAALRTALAPQVVAWTAAWSGDLRVLMVRVIGGTRLNPLLSGSYAHGNAQIRETDDAVLIEAMLDELVNEALRFGLTQISEVTT